VINDYQKATFSGAIDIIVVQDKKGNLKSSPFYARFGALKSRRRKNKVVRIWVNGL